MTNPPASAFSTGDLLKEAKLHIKSLLPSIGQADLDADESARLIAALAPRPGVATLEDLAPGEVVGLLGVVRDIAKNHRIVSDIAETHRAINDVQIPSRRDDPDA